MNADSQPEERTIEVKAISRVEGEGKLYVKLQGESIEQVQLSIYEPPRFFESFLRGRQVHEVPDITARICGICPVAYQMSSCHALEKALGIAISPEIRLLRRLLYCGEWIESHCLHIYLLHAPDFLGYESGISMAVDHREAVERGLAMKKIGNQLVEILGGRAVHPINVTVGGFYRAPSVRDLKALLPRLEWGLEAALETVRWVSRFEFPDFPVPYELVSLKHPDEYPLSDGNVFSSAGLDVPVEEYETHFQETQLPHSTALYSARTPGDAFYLAGPLARLNNCYEQLLPTSKRALEESGLRFPLTNNFHSIVARAVEVVFAFEEAIRIVHSYQAELTPSRIPYEIRQGEGCHATEAPRGLLYHRYRIGEDPLIAEAKIVPPTAQNQGQIEADLREYLRQLLSLDDAAIAQKSEHMIRNYDPCISCATHFLQLTVDRGQDPASPKSE
ncbi:Ni/Fe hydrogenase subunit alpha [Blastopirellula sp. JC732]|uniref:Ni/Fe hydrogenase subunit alpha n=1 Tax=Blastopirellula sediminis TaxID=2894196 RepID=A0A9X1MMB3_9BACT|nr:Ni/Fe hydrogenase subunit alpha [Blastopirellula sediminis]MCC9608343.1 Ni/Fe hydrogenase subunit alpha [Blastopirellula sediminis]MCC9628880.1 Ni/Fe hydrogenase subunit alpha [Blastopirellula sediminis]